MVGLSSLVVAALLTLSLLVLFLNVFPLVAGKGFWVKSNFSEASIPVDYFLLDLEVDLKIKALC
jgi:hypothetical protein